MLRDIRTSQKDMRMLGFRVDGTSTGVKERCTVTCVDDVAGSLNDKYFVLHSALDAAVYHVVFDVSGGLTYVAPAGVTQVSVAIATGDLKAVVGAALQVALDALDDFVATNVNEVVTITNAADGATTDVVDTGLTGFALAVTIVGVTSSISLLEGQRDATLTEASATDGEYLLTFAVPFARTPTVIAAPLTANTVCVVSAISTTAATIICRQGTTGTVAKDADFHAIVMGSDDATETRSA